MGRDGPPPLLGERLSLGGSCLRGGKQSGEQRGSLEEEILPPCVALAAASLSVAAEDGLFYFPCEKESLYLKYL